MELRGEDTVVLEMVAVLRRWLHWSDDVGGRCAGAALRGYKMYQDVTGDREEMNRGDVRLGDMAERWWNMMEPRMSCDGLGKRNDSVRKAKPILLASLPLGLLPAFFAFSSMCLKDTATRDDALGFLDLSLAKVAWQP